MHKVINPTQSDVLRNINVRKTDAPFSVISTTLDVATIGTNHAPFLASRSNLAIDFFQQAFLVYEVWKGARMAYSGRIVVHPYLPIPENRRICHE